MKTIEEINADAHSKKHELTTKVAAITGKLSAYHSLLDETIKAEGRDIEIVKREVDWVLVRLGKAVEELRDARNASY